MTASLKVLGVSDSDSYVKWGSAMLDRMPDEWQREMVVIRTPALPSAAQLEASLAGTRRSLPGLPIVDLADLAALVVAQQPDVVVLSVRGPVVRVLVRMIVAVSAKRPVIVSGLPGISIPETLHALYFRSQVDLIVLHSKREVSAFSALAQRLGIEQDFGLATLPFLPPRSTEERRCDDIVFAAQAKVPKLRSERELILDWLIETARRHPSRQVVIKLRGLAGEAQTHAEKHPYDRLLAERTALPTNLTVSTAGMGEHLERAGAVVTISSTAAVEAMALGVPVLLIDDFGVGASLINVVFEGSGLFGNSAELKDGYFRSPKERWLDSNYFHAPSDETWIQVIEAAVARREAGTLQLRPQYRGTLGGNLRRIWDRKQALGPYDRTVSGYVALAVGVPLRGAVRRVRSMRVRAARARAAEPSEFTAA